MKTCVALLFATVLFFTSFTKSQSYPHITELRGLEDSLSQTHLFYRLVENYGCWSKNIYHYDLDTNKDSIFIPDFGYEVYPGWGCEGDYVNDYEFFDSDFSKFIYCGYNLWIDPVALLRRYDGDIHIEAFALSEIEISILNENLVYVSGGTRFFKSTDGGYNFTINIDSLAFIDNAIISLSRNNDTQIYGINENKLVRSEDEGFNYIIVDNSLWDENSELFYDSDGDHIYGLSVKRNFQTQNYDASIYASNDNGNPFTWNKLVNHTIPIRFTNDEIISGEIYYSLQKNIYRSTNYGADFNLYKTLDANITGLYKKSGTDILYASTPLRIYEIKSDTTQIIKSLPIPNGILDFYPLMIGNYWIYDKYTSIEWNTFHDIFIRKVVKDTLLENGNTYYKIIEYEYGYPYKQIYFERIDSASGKVFRYLETPELQKNEYLIDYLLAEIGDTIQSSREFYDPYFPTIFIERANFNKWGLEKSSSVFQHIGLGYFTHSLTKDIGLDSIGYDFDFGYTDIILKGCIINGIVYGDTTVVSVDDDESQQPTEFSLSQNYPNPFNPSTTIKFTIPNNVIASDTKQSALTTLKVYDVLGNEVASLVNENKPSGEYEIEFDAARLPSGVYFYQLKSGNFIQIKKMVLLK